MMSTLIFVEYYVTSKSSYGILESTSNFITGTAALSIA